MVWVPGGALVAGTPPGSLPRIADAEMQGEQVILKGFYIDVFPFPNEEGALPLTNVSRDEARAHCAEQGKRLCTELEWERACKGPQNRVYEYGKTYDARRCVTGSTPKLVPSGFNVGCRSEFGVHDLHGSVWEWTDSPWGRGTSGERVSVRGGNGVQGEVIARCANAKDERPSTRSLSLGFRCCAGPRNEAEVTLSVARGAKLETRTRPDAALLTRLRAALAELAPDDLRNPKALAFDRAWTWRPIGNEELLVAGGCSGLGVNPSCGVLILRTLTGSHSVLAWASSGVFTPLVQTDVDARDVWLFGGDERGTFRRLLNYAHGRVSVGPKERRLPERKPKKRRR
jgi:hypothetical protein